MKNKILRTEGGQGGKRGHGGMEHSNPTEVIKRVMKRRRRKQGKAIIDEQLEQKP